MFYKESYSTEESEWAQQQIRPYAEICGTSDEDLNDLSLLYTEALERRRTRTLSNSDTQTQTEPEVYRTLRYSVAEDPTDMDKMRMSTMASVRKFSAIGTVVGLAIVETAQAITGQNLREYYPVLATPLAATAMSHVLLWVDRHSYRKVRVPV